MNKTERLKQLAAELNEKFPVGSIVKITALKNKDGSGYFQDHPECKIIIRPFFYVASDRYGDECMKYYKLFKLLIRFVRSIILYEINNRKYITDDRKL